MALFFISIFFFSLHLLKDLTTALYSFYVFSSRKLNRRSINDPVNKNGIKTNVHKAVVHLISSDVCLKTIVIIIMRERERVSPTKAKRSIKGASIVLKHHERLKRGQSVIEEEQQRQEAERQRRRQRRTGL